MASNKDVDSLTTSEEQPVGRLFTKLSLEKENLAYCGTPGVSRENFGNGFRPAFCDSESARVEISRFQNGQPAPIHLIEGLPECWIVERDANSKATAIKHTVIAGFVRNSCFYTRSQAADLALAETTQQSALPVAPAFG
jgi:hypothetical protein